MVSHLQRTALAGPWTLVALILLVAPRPAFAQYWGERALEKSFEQTDFFFVPSSLNPFGIGVFKNSTAGFLRDPLLESIVNPALLTLDSARSLSLYTNFRSARTIKENAGWVYPAYLDMAVRSSYFAPYPWIYRNTRRELEPVFSGAIVARPMPEEAPELHVGVTYQLIMQDDRYYNIPQDIYRSAVGYDYNGTRVAAADKIPIVDKFSGTDEIHQAGHLLTGFGRYVLPQGLMVGARISRVTFDRDGSYGSSNLWSGYSSGGSLWATREARTQGYGHWEVGGGFECTPGDLISFGATGGYLWGDASQEMTNHDTSYYSYDAVTNAGFYNRSDNRRQDWRHEGKTWYAGLDLSARVGPSSVLRLFYQHRATSLDINLASTILDTSYSIYHWTNDDAPQTSMSRSRLMDSRTGIGDALTSLDRITVCAQLGLDAHVSLSVGAQLEWLDSETTTREAVTAADAYASTSTYSSSAYSHSRMESKDLNWDFTTRKWTFQIPIFVTVRPSERVELLFGLNREMAEWRIDDVTLSLFRYRSTTENGQTKMEQNFGERVTEPPEHVSDVRTSFLAGITVGTPQLRFRALMVPVFKDSYDGPELEQLQWWLSMTLSL